MENVIIWGNHSTTQFPDVAHASVTIDGKHKSVREALNDEDWVKHTFVETVQKRGGAVIAARKLSSAMSAAKAICDHMRDWWHGTALNRFVSMGVPSDGSYGVEPGLIFSFPVRIDHERNWHIIADLNIDDHARAHIETTKAELLEERRLADLIVQGD